MKFSALIFGAALVAGAVPASAATIDFDDHDLDSVETYPSVFDGPVGFTEGGFTFSNNIVVIDVHDVANGPAHSGENAAFNDYFKYGYGPEFEITRTGGGTFSFSGLWAQSWSHSANDPITVGVEGFLNGAYVGVIPLQSIVNWTSISMASPGAVGSFALIDKLIIRPSDYALIDDIGLSATTVATTPIPGTLLLLSSALGGLGLLGWRKKRGLSAV